MFAIDLDFAAPENGADLESIGEWAESLLSAWYSNGQIVGSWIRVDHSAFVHFTVRTPEESSLSARHDGSWAREERRRLRDEGVRTTEIVRGRDVSLLPSCSCSAPGGYVLFTTSVAELPPVRCLACEKPVPLYRVPPAEGDDHRQILEWARVYGACETLTARSRFGLEFGTMELRDPASGLGRLGRDLAARLEIVSGEPFYTVLRVADPCGLPSACPSCETPWQEELPSSLFASRCDPCRLFAVPSPR